MNILQEIIAHKHVEVARNKKIVSIKELERSSYMNTSVISMRENLLNKYKSGIIAEIKRKSPSKGIINGNVNIHKISQGYEKAGVSGISVLTDTNYFGGSNEDFRQVRKANSCPMLRKDFMVDEYQILEAKAMGADIILLIAAGIDSKKCLELAKFSKSLGLEILLEIHNKKEFETHYNEHVTIVGVNNRNLETFEVSIDVSKQLASIIPSEITKISESGISHPDAVIELKKYGYQGFLMGEAFMKQLNPEITCEEFINSITES
ncbi:MAG: indole-3-glycerol phosphate synthase [bacterium]|jgi:indole-3-glycerol phosphate synthase